MFKYYKKELIVEAVQWFPPIDSRHVTIPIGWVAPISKAPDRICEVCGKEMGLHVWAETPLSFRAVFCPGNWIIKEENGAISKMTDDDFEQTYHLCDSQPKSQ